MGELRVYLLGASPGVTERAVEKIRDRWPCVTVVGTHSPPLGFENNREHCEQILQLVSDAQPQLLIVGLGAPKQELWLRQYHEQLEARVAIAAGATIDFLKEQFGMDSLADWVLEKTLKDLAFYYDKEQKIGGRPGRGQEAQTLCRRLAR